MALPETFERLNIGAGDKPLPGFLNVDLPEFDATKPWPIETGSLIQVNADCVLPHIKDGEALDQLINECARVLAPNDGVFTFSVPDWRRPAEALQDVHHYRLIGPRTFYHYCNEPTKRPVEASGNWFQKPTWKYRRVEPDNVEGYLHPLMEGLLPLSTIRLGSTRMTWGTHLAMRLNATPLLRSGRLNWSMKRNGRVWE